MRRRTRRNPAESAGIQILIAGATAAVTTTIAVLITNWLTREATVQSVAKGETPLPPGSTPTTTGPPITVTPAATPQPEPAPLPAQLAQLTPDPRTQYVPHLVS